MLLFLVYFTAVGMVGGFIGLLLFMLKPFFREAKEHHR